MGDLGGGKQVGGIWDRKAQQVQGDAGKAFQRTRMAPAVSHERGTDYRNDPPKALKPVSRRAVAGRRR